MIKYTGKSYINGTWQVGLGSSLSSINPGNNEVVWRGHTTTADQIDSAVSAARSAFAAWRGLGVDDRIERVETFAELLNENSQSLADVISAETGKPHWEAKTEVATMVNKVAISIKAFHERTGGRVSEGATSRQVLRHKPHGVLAIFGPYNFPGHLPNGHIVPALIAGNTLLFKPSEQTPFTAEVMTSLWQQVLPMGVFNLLQGEVETGKALSMHSSIDGLLFTGSATTGRYLHQQFSGQPEKILALEMGGNNPLIIRSFDNLEAMANLIIMSSFITAGQRCTCTRRLFIPVGATGDELLALLASKAGRLPVAGPNPSGPSTSQTSDPEPFMGPVISLAAARALLASYQDLLALGGQSILEMKHLVGDTGLVSPAIVDVTAIADLPDKEYFGPLLQVIRYDDFDTAIEQANNTHFGLAAGMLGGSEDDFDYFHDQIRAGIVNWNQPTTGASSAAPFGGIGASGNHRPSAWYAADYCAYPVASVESAKIATDQPLLPGMD